MRKSRCGATCAGHRVRRRRIAGLSAQGALEPLLEALDLAGEVLGDGFLYNMVRIIAGTLMEVGTGKREPGCIARAIATGDRLLLGQTAPACGLMLMRVLYGGDEEKALGYFA